MSTFWYYNYKTINGNINDVYGDGKSNWWKLSINESNKYAINNILATQKPTDPSQKVIDTFFTCFIQYTYHA